MMRVVGMWVWGVEKMGSGKVVGMMKGNR